MMVDTDGVTKIGGEIVGVTKIGGEIVGGVCGEEEAGGGRRSGRRAPGIQNQKQEPHTKLWGKTLCYKRLPFLELLLPRTHFVLHRIVMPGNLLKFGLVWTA
jgi:hypothetical protein